MLLETNATDFSGKEPLQMLRDAHVVMITVAARTAQPGLVAVVTGRVVVVGQN